MCVGFGRKRSRMRFGKSLPERKFFPKHWSGGRPQLKLNMFGSTSLEVATGLVFIFLLISLMVTAVGEIIANLINARAKCLWKGVAAILENSATQVAGKNPWTVMLYAHPIMRPLFPLETQGKEAEIGPKGQGPSYIPPASFAAALLEITDITSAAVNGWQHTLQQRLEAIPTGDGSAAAALQAVKGVADEITGSLEGTQLKADLEKVAAQWQTAGAPDSGAGASLERIAGQIAGGLLDPVRQQLLDAAKAPDLATVRNIIGLIPVGGGGVGSASVRNGLLTLLSRLEADPTALATAKMFANGIVADHARQALAKLDNSDLRGALQTLLNQAQGDVEKLKVNVESWFNHSMDRVQGWYKRKTMWVQVAVAAVLTIFMNVDTLVVLRHLCADPALRQSVLAQAEAVEKNPPAAVAAPEASAATPAEPEAPAPATSPSPAAGKTVTRAMGDSQSLRRQLLDLGLPIGWGLASTPKNAGAATEKTPAGGAAEEYRTAPELGPLLHGEGWGRLGLTIRFHLLGWLLTIVAASLGAPFWFDVLKNFMNIRSAGKPPEK